MLVRDGLFVYSSESQSAEAGISNHSVIFRHFVLRSASCLSFCVRHVQQTDRSSFNDGKLSPTITDARSCYTNISPENVLEHQSSDLADSMTGDFKLSATLRGHDEDVSKQARKHSNYS